MFVFQCLNSVLYLGVEDLELETKQVNSKIYGFEDSKINID